MEIDLTAPQSRRTVLAAVFGGVAAAAANAMAMPAAVLATDGQPILQGADNSGSASTVVRSNSTTALQGVTDVATGANFGVRGRSSSSSGIGTVGIAPSATGSTVGVRGDVFSTNGIGVLGQNNDTSQFARGVVGVSPGGVGVQGWSGSLVPQAGMAKVGVYGECNIDFASAGTLGISNTGSGVRGLTTTGIGVEALAINASATGLKVQGKAMFSRSGRATVLAGQSQVVVNGIPLTSSSLVLATIQGAGAAGLYVRSVSVSVSNSRFTIRLSQNVAANTLVGWFIAN